MLQRTRHQSKPRRQHKIPIGLSKRGFAQSGFNEVEATTSRVSVNLDLTEPSRFPIERLSDSLPIEEVWLWANRILWIFENVSWIMLRRVIPAAPLAASLASVHRRPSGLCRNIDPVGRFASSLRGVLQANSASWHPHMDFLIEIVRAEPDITLAELNNALEDTFGLRVQPSSIHRALHRAGFSYKKRAYCEGT